MKEIENEPELKNDNWSLVFLILPVVVFPNFSDSIDMNIPEIAMKAILGGLGGAIGTLIFMLVNDKSKFIKISVLVLMMVVFIGVLVFF